MKPASLVPSCFLSRAALSAAAVLLLCRLASVQGQPARFCEGEVGEADWACQTLSPLPAQAFDGLDEFLPLPGSVGTDSFITYKQLAGEPVAFDADSGARSNSTGTGSAAVFVLKGGPFYCMVAESDGEAAIFDAPEGTFISSTTEFPTSTFLSGAIEAVLAKDSKLKYIVYSHPHWDHIGAAGLVSDHFAEDVPPTIVASKRTRWALKKKEQRDPNTSLGNNRGVPIPDKLYDSEGGQLSVGSLRFDLQAIQGHQPGNLLMSLDKNVAENAAQGIRTSILMVVDIVYPGWSPFFLAAGARDIGSFYDALEQINGYDFDVLIPGHVSRLGTKADVQVQIEFYADILKGSEFGRTAASFDDIFAGTGTLDPTNPNAGNTWLDVNELNDRRIDACVAYVLDSESRGRNWLAELAGVEPMLRSQCYIVLQAVLFG